MALPTGAKVLIAVGAGLIFVGVLWALAPGVFNRLGRLPGDIAIERGPTRVYFPIVTSLLLSVLLSLILILIRWWKGNS